MATHILLDNDVCTLSHEPESSLIVFKRKPKPLPARPDAPEFLELERALSAFEPTRVAILFDMRDAPPVGDDNYEQTVRDARRRFVSKFSTAATIVKTAVGKLQATRLAREQGDAGNVFSDEAEARAYLATRLRDRAGSSAPRRRK